MPRLPDRVIGSSSQGAHLTNHRALLTTEDLDQLFRGDNAFARCSPRNRRILRRVIEQHVEEVVIYELGPRHATFPKDPLPLNHLYGVLRGRVRVQWESGPERQFSLGYHSASETFGEVQCGLVGGASPLQLHVRAVQSRKERQVRLVEFPTAVLAQLLKNSEFHSELASGAFAQLRHALLRVIPTLLGEPALTLAHVCISPWSGTERKLHRTMRYLGARVCVKKTISIDELMHLAGFAAPNTVRKWLALLKQRQLIRTRSRRPDRTRIFIPNVDRVVSALTRGGLTTTKHFVYDT